MAGKIFKRIILLVLLTVFLASAAVVVHYFLQAYIAQSDMNRLSAMKVEQNGVMTEKGFLKGDYVSLYNKNKDIIGWVKIKRTKIDYPVMQTKKDPEYYLRRNYDKEYEISGTPFMDAASDVYTPTQNWLIYGHNMHTGIMFHGLLNYSEKEFYDKHKQIQFDTIYLGQQATYEVIAAFFTEIDTTGFRYFDYAGMTGEEQYEEYIQGIKNLSLYDTGVSAEYGEQLITLSTCSYHVPDKKGRFVVVAKIVGDEE